MGSCRLGDLIMSEENQKIFGKKNDLEAARSSIGKERLHCLEQAITDHRFGMEVRKQIMKRGVDAMFARTEEWEIELKAIKDYFNKLRLFMDGKISFKPKFITQSLRKSAKH